MPTIVLAALLAMLLATIPAPGAAPLHLGRVFALTQATPIVELERHPAQYFNREVRIEGVIASAGAQDGSFIEVVPATGPGEGIVVTLPDTTRLPVDCIGLHAVVEGMYYRKIYPASRVAHWQAHSFRRGKPVPEFSRIERMTARAAEIGTRGPTPPLGDIVPAATDRVDLATTEFEADGFGTGRKHLAPGEVTERHNTGRMRELIFCLEGTVTLRLGTTAPVTLRAGEMSYIPPGTDHELRNPGPGPMTYIFVFSRAPEPQPAQEPRAH